MPKEHEEDDDVTRKLRDEGCAPQIEPEEEHCQEEEEVISKKHKKGMMVLMNQGSLFF
jgi:RNA-binding motif X-linked protein 2